MPFTSDRISPQNARLLPWLVAVAFFMQMLDGTILNTALPGMAGELGVSALRMQAVIIAYMLTTALLMPASGWIADRFGLRKVFVASLLVFSLGSLLCALSTTLDVLVLSRVIQGIGGAIMVPVGRLAILKAYPRAELVRVLSFVTIPGLMGPLLGPVTGGFLVQYTSWHWIFLINLPVGLVGALLACKAMPDLRNTVRERFDVPGFLLFGLSMVCLCFAMEGFGELQMPKVQATLLCLAGGVLMSVYWIRARSVQQPLFSPALFRIRSFAVGIIGNIFARMGSSSMPFLIPLFLQLGLGYAPFSAGLIMMPSALAAIVGKQIITPVVARMGFRRFLVINTSLVGLLIAAFALITPQTGIVGVVAMACVFGIVNSMQFTAMNTVTLIDLPDQDAGSGNSLLSVTMQIAAVTGVALGAALVSGLSGAPGGGGEAATARDGLVHVFHMTFILIGGLTLATSLIFAQTPPEAGKQAPAASKTPS